MEREHSPKPSTDHAYAAPDIESDLAPETDHAPVDLDRLWGAQPAEAPTADADTKLFNTPTLSAGPDKAAKPAKPAMSKVTSPASPANFKTLQDSAGDKTSAAFSASILLAAHQIDDAATRLEKVANATTPDPRGPQATHDDVKARFDAVAGGQEVTALANRIKDADKKKPPNLGPALTALSSAKLRLEAAAAHVKPKAKLDNVSVAGLSAAIERLYIDHGYKLPDLLGSSGPSKSSESSLRGEALGSNLGAARANVNAMRVGLIPATENKLNEELQATMSHIDEATALIKSQGKKPDAETTKLADALDAEITALTPEVRKLGSKPTFQDSYTASSIQSKMTALRDTVHKK